MNFVKNFLIAFLVTTIVFAPLAFFGTRYVVNNSFEKDKDKVDTIDTDDSSLLGYNSNSHGIFSMMSVVTSKVNTRESYSGAGAILSEKYSTKPDIKIEFITIVRINCDSKKAAVSAIPGDVMVDLLGSQMSVTDAYYYYKTGKYDLPDNYIAELVKGLTGATVDVYDFVDINDYVKIADDLGGLNVNIENAVTIVDQDTIHFYPVGYNTLNTNDLKSLINYEGYNTVSEKMKFISALCDAVLQKSLTTGTYINVKDKWNYLQKNAVWSITDFEVISSYLDELFTYRFCKVELVGLKGGYVSVHGNRLFKIDLDSYISSLKL